MRHALAGTVAVIELKVGHARVSTLSTHTQYLTAQRDALAACRPGDTRVTTLDRLAHALPDGFVAEPLLVS